MNLRFIDWIWHVRGTLPLAPAQSGDDALDRLAPLFGQPGTSYDCASLDGAVQELTFTKKDQAAQDKMSVFDGGTLRIEAGADGAVLRYHLISRALLFCFLAPLLFLGIAQLTIVFDPHKNAPTEKAEKAKKADKKDEVVQLNPIDKALGAPAPEKPDKDDEDGGKGGSGKHGKKPATTPAYVFAGIFAALYLIGRILEDRLIRRLFRKTLAGD
ncbi:hypothetical protein [Novosphingobium sp.]|uniref:hypothetical protein n=1 Tax=Novosphingobium sp. TaxID=1874826 RepID=UPI0038B7C278